jgi:hypothetical protein
MTASPDVSTSPERHEPVVEPPPKRLITLETIAKSVTFLGLSMGFVGYLTINMFLSRFGFPDFSPINPRFVYVGALVLLSMALPVALLIMMVWVFWYGAKGYTRPTRPHTTVFHMVGDGTRWFWHHLYRRYFLGPYARSGTRGA